MLENTKRAKIKYILLISPPVVPFFRKLAPLNMRPLRHNPDLFKNNLFSVVRLHLGYETIRLSSFLSNNLSPDFPYQNVGFFFLHYRDKNTIRKLPGGKPTDNFTVQ